MRHRIVFRQLAVVIGGACCVVMCFLLANAYLPDFMPRVYHNLRRSGLILMVPTLAAVGLISSIGWLWWECREESALDEDQEE